MVPAEVAMASDHAGPGRRWVSAGLMIILLAASDDKTPAFPSSKEIISNVGLRTSLASLLT